MDIYEEQLAKEHEYLEKTLNFVKGEFDKVQKLLSNRKSSLIEARKEMWESNAHFSKDFDKLTEMNQAQTDLDIQTAVYNNTVKLLEKYGKIMKSPYFGRFDFVEKESGEQEKIYIGRYNIMDSESYDILVYDWRAPISSIFYQFELGEAFYKSPEGRISGDVVLKRQYKIENSKFIYYFDCNVNITDELLQEVLSKNTSPKMRTIVETIQKDQDLIIRDTENELLVVQGVAGSGKTSIALHRIAYLLYEGMNKNFGSNNILIISPNAVFSKYISSVLPDLGEENVMQKTFDEILLYHFGNRFKLENRSAFLESLLINSNSYELNLKKESLRFKGSRAFAALIKKLILFYEKQLINVKDVNYQGELIESKEKIKEHLLNNKINMPLAKRLKRIESMLVEKLHPLQRAHIKTIEEEVAKSGEHEFEVKAYSRMLSIQENHQLLKKIQEFTEVDYFQLYKTLFENKQLFLDLAEGLDLPDCIEVIIKRTSDRLENGVINFEDCASLLYLKLELEGSDNFNEIKQVVVDEAQDYYPMQYEIFKLLFKGARFTVLGDNNQAIEKEANNTFYDEIVGILDKRKSVKVFLNKGYRSSFEINMFNQRLLGGNQDFDSFERYETEPDIICMDTKLSVNNAITEDIDNYLKEGFESIAVVCKSAEEALDAYRALSNLTRVRLINSYEGEIEKGVLVIPSYIAKGLEFDAVVVYDVSKENYNSYLDKKLLYVACTRALHRLKLYYTGEKSIFL